MSTKGMIFIDTENKILQDILIQRIGQQTSRPVEPCDIRLCDFDDVLYNLVIDATTLQLSIAYRPLKELEKFGAKAMLSEQYSKIPPISTKAGYDLTLQTNLDTITASSCEEIIQKLSDLKRNLLGAPFDQCFKALKSNTSSSLSPIQIPFRKNETIYVRPQQDRIVVVYSICFDDTTDQAIARVFLQEFAEARRNVNNAPPVTFTRDPPLELRGVQGLRNTSDLVGYLSIAIFSSHVDTDEKRAKAVSLIQGLRNYLHYHIKASKTYLHIRMRKRVDLLLHVLNRAHPDKDPTKVIKKTMSGKTFSRT